MHKSDEILDDMLKLSAQVIRFVELKRVPFSVKDQLIRAVSSIGANYSEAQDASSKRDFLNQICTAKKEAGAAKYWLKLVERLTVQDEQIEKFTKEVQGFCMMFQQIINTSKDKTGNREPINHRELVIGTR